VASKTKARTSKAAKGASKQTTTEKRRSRRPPEPQKGEAELAALEAGPSGSDGEVPPASRFWQERADKDSYALDLLDRLTRYFGGRAAASPEVKLRAAAEILNALAFGLAADDDALLDALRQRARELMHRPPAKDT
jgi:hypothetical protein